jgi:predicted MFS family arabinose efflux permease
MNNYDTKNEDTETQIMLLAEAEFQSNFDRSVIYSLFFLVFFSNIMINIDHGTLPGSTKHIEKYLGIGDFGFGILGSVVYAGLTLGSAWATIIFNRGEWIKPALAISLFMNSVCLYAFTVSNNFFISCLVRGLIGFFQVFVCIFYPVWADAYGNEKQKSIWLTVLLLASPIGVVMGYTLTFYMQKYLSWEWSFYIQAIAILPCAGCFLITPSKYINIA